MSFIFHLYKEEDRVQLKHRTLHDELMPSLHHLPTITTSKSVVKLNEAFREVSKTQLLTVWDKY